MSALAIELWGPWRPDLPMADQLQETSDEMLMIRYKRGDRTAFASLVRRYERPLYNFALRFLSNRESAREVTQEVFLRAVRRAGEFRHEARFSTWIFTITRNVCVDQLRRDRHRRTLALEEDDSKGIATEGSLPSGEEQLNRNRLRDALLRAVDALPEEQREVFLLRQLGDVPFADIAELTGTPENTVKSRMRYALDRLQRELCQFEEYARALR